MFYFFTKNMQSFFKILFRREKHTTSIRQIRSRYFFILPSRSLIFSISSIPYQGRNILDPSFLQGKSLTLRFLQINNTQRSINLRLIFLFGKRTIHNSIIRDMMFLHIRNNKIKQCLRTRFFINQNIFLLFFCYSRILYSRWPNHYS